MLVGNVQLVQGDADAIDSILEMLEREGEAARGSADLYARTYAHFGIDEAREIRERAASGGVSGRRVFVLAMPGMTGEAQNALLKTLEEPAGDALFFFLMPFPETLLPTFRSRAQLLSPTTVAEAKAGSIDTSLFLQSSPAERLKLLEPLLEKSEDDRRDMGAIITFLSSLERTLGERPKDAAVRRGLEALYRARAYIGDKGALVKPLLEQVALLV
jgi:DNA polymerase III delta prime subunit